MPARGASIAHVFGSGDDSSGGPTRKVLRNPALSGFPDASSQWRSMTREYDLPASRTGPTSSRGLSPRLIRPGSNTSVKRVPSGDQSSSSSSRNGASTVLPVASSINVMRSIRFAPTHRGRKENVEVEQILR